MFATTADVATRLGRALTADETAKVTALIASATALIATTARQSDEWASTLSPVPEILKSVTVEVVHRVLTNPTGASSLTEQLGSYQHGENYRSDMTGLSLTRDERRLVRRAAGWSARTVTLESPYSGPALIQETTA